MNKLFSILLVCFSALAASAQTTVGLKLPSASATYNIYKGGSDTSAIQLSTLGVKYNDPTFDNGPIINAAIISGNKARRKVDGGSEYDTLYSKTQLIAKSFTGLRNISIKFAFSTSKIGLTNNFASEQLIGWSEENVHLDWTGANVAHGQILSNTNGNYFNGVWMTGNQAKVLGGAIGIGPFNAAAAYRNFNGQYFNIHVVGGGNFGLQFGNAVNTHVDGLYVDSTFREGLGIEPYNSAGEGGVVDGMWVSNVVMRTQPGVTVNGSSTGLLVITSSSGGTMNNIHLNHFYVKGSTQASQSGLGIYGAQNTWIEDGFIDSVGGYSLNVTSAGALNGNDIHIARLKLNVGGRDGVVTSGMLVKDTRESYFEDLVIKGNSIGFTESGTSELNTFKDFNLRGNTTAYVPNSGRPHTSQFINLQSDSLMTYNFAGAPIGVPNFTANPATPALGAIYYNSSTSHFFGWNGTTWKQLDN